MHLLPHGHTFGSEGEGGLHPRGGVITIARANSTNQEWKSDQSGLKLVLKSGTCNRGQQKGVSLFYSGLLINRRANRNKSPKTRSANQNELEGNRNKS